MQFKMFLRNICAIQGRRNKHAFVKLQSSKTLSDHLHFYVNYSHHISICDMTDAGIPFSFRYPLESELKISEYTAFCW